MTTFFEVRLGTCVTSWAEQTTRSNPQPMIGEKQQLITDEPVEFEK